MTSDQIRQSFLDFFHSKQHTIVPSSSLMPDSPNLLFTNAGMNQFVPIFLAQQLCPYKPGRAADTQKCIRAGGKHNDLEDVGIDTYHQTLFEMLGNWSFGDYFKKEAIAWAWELITEVWKFPKNRLYATVYKPDPSLGDPAAYDQEAADEWTRLFTAAGLDPKVHIVNGNKKDNFWMMGETGPCGPCSEIHVDLTPAGDTKGALVNAGDPRCIEIWNLVFIQFNATPDGQFAPLPARHVDTGMGFERVCSIIQGTKNFTDFANARISNYETDVFRPIIAEIEKLCGHRYGSSLPGDAISPEQLARDIAFRVIADHIRTLSFAVADGIMPSNLGRGFVLRRILRRAVRYGRNLDLHGIFFSKLCAQVAAQFGGVFPELRSNLATVEKVIRAEEESFAATLDRGIQLFEAICSKLDQNKVVPGDAAFELYDTYGFPLDLTELMARERGLSVDAAGFDLHMEQQRERARSSQKREVISVSSDSFSSVPPTRFVGFDKLEVEATVVGFDNGVAALDASPFYAEMGGQVGDTGFIATGSQRYAVIDTRKSPSGVFLHKLESGELPLGSTVSLCVDTNRRGRIQAHHSATHLMHWALRTVLGDTVGQKGSSVGPDRLRFDFSHGSAMTPEQVAQVESMVNTQVAAADPVSWQERPYSEAKNDKTILQFFGEKYGETVRVVDIGGYSRELCGGTHVRSTGEIGFFKIVSEGAIAAGIRRIEAVCGPAVTDYAVAETQKLAEKHELLKKKKASIPDLVLLDTNESPEMVWKNHEIRLSQLSELEEQAREWEREQKKRDESEMGARASSLATDLLAAHSPAPSFAVQVADADGKLLQAVADQIKARYTGPFVLAGAKEGRVSLIALVPAELSKKLSAGKLIQTIAPLVGGKGGGRPEMAQAGGSDPSGIAAALESARALMQ